MWEHAVVDPPEENPATGSSGSEQETTMTEITDITDFDERVCDDAVGQPAEDLIGCDHAASASGSINYSTGTEFWQIEELARRLLIAVMERGTLPFASAEAKACVLACFWVAAHFNNVSAALAHTYGDDGLPVGKSFDEFAKSFLSPEAYAEMVAD